MKDLMNIFLILALIALTYLIVTDYDFSKQPQSPPYVVPQVTYPGIAATNTPAFVPIPIPISTPTMAPLDRTIIYNGKPIPAVVNEYSDDMTLIPTPTSEGLSIRRWTGQKVTDFTYQVGDAIGGK